MWDRNNLREGEIMLDKIKSRVKVLGGKGDESAVSVMGFLQSLVFDKIKLIDLEETPFTEFFVDEFYDEFLEMDTIPNYEDMETSTRVEISPKKFAPFTEGSDDYEEWGSELDMKEAIETYFGSGDLEFLKLAYSYGYPDCLFVKLNDESDDPMVYGTDHEEYFVEIDEVCTVSKLFDCILTNDEYISEMEKLKKELKEDKENESNS